MVQSYFVALMLFGGPIAWVGQEQSGDMKVEQVLKLHVAAAEADAQAAIARGDTRLLAVYGFTVEIPGIGGNIIAARQKYGVRILEGTTDAIKGLKDKQVNEIARGYATRYNRFIVSRAAKR